MPTPSEQEQKRQLLYASARSVLGAIMSVGVQTAVPKLKPDEVIERSLRLADTLLKAVNASAIVAAYYPDPVITDNVVASFTIEES